MNGFKWVKNKKVPEEWCHFDEMEKAMKANAEIKKKLTRSGFYGTPEDKEWTKAAINDYLAAKTISEVPMDKYVTSCSIFVVKSTSGKRRLVWDGA